MVEVLVVLATLLVAVLAGVGIGVFADNALARTRKRRSEAGLTAV